MKAKWITLMTAHHQYWISTGPNEKNTRIQNWTIHPRSRTLEENPYRASTLEQCSVFLGALCGGYTAWAHTSGAWHRVEALRLQNRRQLQVEGRKRRGTEGHIFEDGGGRAHSCGRNGSHECRNQKGGKNGFRKGVPATRGWENAWHCLCCKWRRPFQLKDNEIGMKLA